MELFGSDLCSRAENKAGFSEGISVHPFFFSCPQTSLPRSGPCSGSAGPLPTHSLIFGSASRLASTAPLRWSQTWTPSRKRGPRLSSDTSRATSDRPKGVWVIQHLPLSHLSECFFLVSVLSHLSQGRTDFKAEGLRGKDRFNPSCLPAAVTGSFPHPFPYPTSDLLLQQSLRSPLFPRGV